MKCDRQAALPLMGGALLSRDFSSSPDTVPRMVATCGTARVADEVGQITLHELQTSLLLSPPKTLWGGTERERIAYDCTPNPFS